jgi:hypothetical protein
MYAWQHAPQPGAFHAITPGLGTTWLSPVAEDEVPLKVWPTVSNSA